MCSVDDVGELLAVHLGVSGGSLHFAGKDKGREDLQVAQTPCRLSVAFHPSDPTKCCAHGITERPDTEAIEQLCRTHAIA